MIFMVEINVLKALKFASIGISGNKDGPNWQQADKYICFYLQNICGLFVFSVCPVLVWCGVVWCGVVWCGGV